MYVAQYLPLHFFCCSLSLLGIAFVMPQDQHEAIAAISDLHSLSFFQLVDSEDSLNTL